mmetsp:Transcript_3431/g.6632  ORF Transcript_3431/g.6632 Transcript_3431/m.6632 type:complete len:93 (-) Transcript_3431:392-670(-)
MASNAVVESASLSHNAVMSVRWDPRAALPLKPRRAVLPVHSAAEIHITIPKDAAQAVRSVAGMALLFFAASPKTNVADAGDFKGAVKAIVNS